MLVFQSTSLAALSAIRAPSRTERNAKHLIGNVYLEQIERPRRDMPPLITLTLHKLRATRKGLRTEPRKGKHAHIPWHAIVKNCIPDPVGRVLDAGGTVPMSTMTVHAKVAAELGLIQN